MLRGMTGFGSASGRFGHAKILVELKSLNHKFFEVLMHLPEGFLSFEDALKKIIAAKVRRGRISLVLSASGLYGEEVILNKEIARRYYALLKELKRQLKIKEDINLSTVIHMPGILVLEKRLHTDKRLLKFVEGLVKEALQDLLEMRLKEGSAIAADLEKRIKGISSFCEKIKVRAGRVLQIKQNKLSIEEFQMYQRATDVTEEILRLRLHLKNFLSTMRKDEPVGKELDFIAQELQREVNTIGAKSQDGTVSSLVIKIKTQVEKIREQLQNVE